MSTNLIQLYNDILYGSSNHDPEFSLIGGDSRDIFEKLLKTQPADWVYRTKKVKYERNRFGHRCKEIEQVGEDFILFAGCSLTEGLALALEDTFAYNLSKELGLDYYNLGVVGSGPDMIATNISMWFKNIRRIPKLVVIQWPSPDRFYKQVGDGITPMGPWIVSRYDMVDEKMKKQFKYDVVDDAAIKAFVSADEAGYFEHYSQVFKEVTLNYLSILNVPCVVFTEDDVERVDSGRDLIHPGIESNKNLVRFLRSKI